MPMFSPCMPCCQCISSDFRIYLYLTDGRRDGFKVVFNGTTLLESVPSTGRIFYQFVSKAGIPSGYVSTPGVPDPQFVTVVLDNLFQPPHKLPPYLNNLQITPFTTYNGGFISYGLGVGVHGWYESNGGWKVCEQFYQQSALTTPFGVVNPFNYFTFVW